MADIPGRGADEIRTTLEAMGEAKVRHLLSQQLMVHHMIVPAHEWLTELDQQKGGSGNASAEG